MGISETNFELNAGEVESVGFSELKNKRKINLPEKQILLLEINNLHLYRNFYSEKAQSKLPTC